MITLSWIILTALTVWAFTRARAAARISALRAQLSRLHEEAEKEIRRCREEAARAKAAATQISREAASWAAGHQQGRDDVFAMVPLLVEARDRFTVADPGTAPSAGEG